MKEPFVSVVIPTYNRKDKIMASAESVLGQSYRNLELIIVDDASADGTEALFAGKTDPRMRYVRYEENQGACHARNYGAALAKGELIAFHDSDDLWHKDKLEKQVSFLLEHPADLCFCGMNRVAANGNHFYFPVHPFHAEHGLADVLAENRAATQTLLMYRRVWENLKFDEEIRRYQDWDFIIRAAKDYRLTYLPEALVESEVGNDSISARVNSYPHLLHLYEKHQELYQDYPASDAVMNRRMGRRVHQSDPRLAASYFRKSFRLSKNPVDLPYIAVDMLRPDPKKSGKKVSA